jgi:squalene-hopene/tetraprenyl-beta-curcumene cyclase
MAMRQTQIVEDLRVSTEKVDLNWELALKYVAKLQDNDQKDNDNYGGFGYESTGARGGVTENKSDGKLKLRGFGSMTYAGLESMIYAQVDRSDPRVRSALQWAARHWSVDENPGMGTKGLFYYYNVMGKALSICGVETLSVDAGGKAITWKEEIIGKLASMQKEDGRWVNDDGSFWENDPMLVTAYSVLTLEYALRK